MNFPVGSVASKGEVPYDLVFLANQLFEKNFNGYLIQSVRGSLIEEGVLFFREGEICACMAECLAMDRTVKGNEALELFFNQTRGMGFYQCIELTRSQVDLVTAFDEKLLVNKIVLKELPKSIPSSFSNKFEREIGKIDVLQAYGLSELK
ncbi:MAG: hypothetical protein WC821_03415 [archaeon]|jgi:hypothetical protein